MKILTVCVLCWAVMAPGRAAALPEEKAEDNQTERSKLAKRSVLCSSGWTRFNGACYKYIPTSMTCARAEINCKSMGAHLASVQSAYEHREIQKMIEAASHDHGGTWIGGTNAQEDSVWLWTDGGDFYYTSWCSGEPNNLGGRQHCIQINFGGQGCWDDVDCEIPRSSVCEKRECVNC